MTAPLPDAVGVGDFSLMNDPYLPDVLIAAADDLEPFMLGEVEMPSLNCALPAYLRDTATLIQSQAARIAELEALTTNLANELEAEVEHRYAGIKDHPAMTPKYERDMETVCQARSLLSEGEGK